MNIHGKRDMEHIASLEMLEVSRMIACAHTDILLGAYDLARNGITRLILKADSIKETIPPQEGE